MSKLDVNCHHHNDSACFRLDCTTLRDHHSDDYYYLFDARIPQREQPIVHFWQICHRGVI